MEWLWLALLAVIVFLMYMWFRPFPTAVSSGGCNTCPGKKNVPDVE
jgi:hypothetical protein